LWAARDRVAQHRDIAPRRVLPDTAIVDAAIADPKTIDDLVALPVFGGRNQRRSAALWLAALQAARESRNLPDIAEPSNGPPPPARWSRRKPDAAARLEAARAGLAEVSQRVGVPTENLISPDLVRRLCWDWEGGSEGATARNVGDLTDQADRVLESVDDYLRAGKARPWQRELVDPVLATAVTCTTVTEAAENDDR
jgi:ribonuclease D